MDVLDPVTAREIERNKAVVRRFVAEIFVAGRPTPSTSWSRRTSRPTAGRRPATRGATSSGAIGRVGDGLADPEFSVEDLIAEGDRVAARLTTSATHVGEFMGMPATDKRYTIEEIHIFRLRDGQVVEHWHQFNPLALMQQLGRQAARLISQAGVSPRSMRTTRRSVTIAVISAAGVTSNAGLRARVAGGGRAHAAEARDLVRVALLDRDLARRTASPGRPSTRARRPGTARRRARAGARAKAADLVRGVAVAAMRSAPIDDDVGPAADEHRRRRAVDDQAERRAHLRQLPRGEPRALEQRPRLAAAGPPRACPARAARRSRPAPSRAPPPPARPCCRWSSRGSRGRATSSPIEVRATGRHRGAGGDVLVADPLAPPRGRPPGPPARQRERPVDGPGEVHRGRPAARSRSAPRPDGRVVVRVPRPRAATPNAPATPSAGAPRTASRRIASTSGVERRGPAGPRARRAAGSGR